MAIRKQLISHDTGEESILIIDLGNFCEWESLTQISDKWWKHNIMKIVSVTNVYVNGSFIDPKRKLI